MSNPLPNALALSVINDGDQAIASVHRNNYAAVQGAVNLLRAALAGGIAGQVLEAVDGTDVVWATGPGAEIGYDQITAGVNVAGTVIGSATTIIAGSAHSFDGAPVMMEFFSPKVVSPSVAGNAVVICLFEGGTPLADVAYVVPTAAANLWTPVTACFRFTPTAGNHTYSIKAYASSLTGTPSVQAGAGGNDVAAPAYLRFTKV